MNYPEFDIMLEHLKKIILYCEFNDPKLSLSITEYSKRKIDPPSQNASFLFQFQNNNDSFSSNNLLMI